MIIYRLIGKTVRGVRSLKKSKQETRSHGWTVKMGSRADLKRGWCLHVMQRGPRERLGCCPHPVPSHTQREGAREPGRQIRWLGLPMCPSSLSFFFSLTWNAPHHSGRWIHFFPFDFGNGSNSFLTKCRRNLTLPHPAPSLPGSATKFLGSGWPWSGPHNIYLFLFFFSFFF